MPEARAKARTFSHFHYLYLGPPLRALIAQDNPKARDEKLVNEKLSELTTRFDQLEGMLAERRIRLRSQLHIRGLRAAPNHIRCHQCSDIHWRQVTA
jgi:hypothetical protein